MKPELIELQNQDFHIIKEIYDYYILNSTATFHTEPISMDELKSVIPVGHPKYKSFLIKDQAKICGYCYFSQFKTRQAYNRTAEVTIYLNHDCIGKGLGKKVIAMMDEMAKEIGFKVLIAGITAENTSSVLLFEKCGYEKCAHYRQVGEKFNRVLDVVFYQKII